MDVVVGVVSKRRPGAAVAVLELSYIGHGIAADRIIVAAHSRAEWLPLVLVDPLVQFAPGGGLHRAHRVGGRDVVAVQAPHLLAALDGRVDSATGVDLLGDDLVGAPGGVPVAYEGAAEPYDSTVAYIEARCLVD